MSGFVVQGHIFVYVFCRWADSERPVPVFGGTVHPAGDGVPWYRDDQQ